MSTILETNNYFPKENIISKASMLFIKFFFFFLIYPFVKNSFHNNIYTLDEWSIKPSFKL